MRGHWLALTVFITGLIFIAKRQFVIGAILTAWAHNLDRHRGT